MTTTPLQLSTFETKCLLDEIADVAARKRRFADRAKLIDGNRRDALRREADAFDRIVGQLRGNASPARIYPDEISPQLHDVLRLMNFRTVPIAHSLRAGGAPIPPKAEEEQAFVLHWMIKLALDHPDDWHKRVGDRLDEIAKQAKSAMAGLKL